MNNILAALDAAEPGFRTGMGRIACVGLRISFGYTAHGLGLEVLAVVARHHAERRFAQMHRLFEHHFNTGARSPGELLMTPSTSAVAVCCSKASRVSLMSRAFSIAMTACAANF